MTFGLHYAFSENFVLPISHDEVVHGKGSMIEKMPGDWWQKWANLRAYYGFMWGHPGKKLLFMGCEFGQPARMEPPGQLDWDAAPRGPTTRASRASCATSTRSTARTPALHVRDCEPEGFQWIEGGDAENSIFAWIRPGHDGRPARASWSATSRPSNGATTASACPGRATGPRR